MKKIVFVFFIALNIAFAGTVRVNNRTYRTSGNTVYLNGQRVGTIHHSKTGVTTVRINGKTYKIR